MNKKKILILGVTASGKGKLAFEIAKIAGGEIVSIDSMKVYRRMDIGTAKPSLENRTQIPHHLIDVVEPSESFSVGRFIEFADTAIKDILARNKPVVAVGGTAMYIKALLYGLFEGAGTDETIRDQIKARIANEGLAVMHRELATVDADAAHRIHANDAKRIIRAMEVYQLTGRPISSFQQQFGSAGDVDNWVVIGLCREKTDASHRINMRVKRMIEEEFMDEVKRLLAEERPLSQQARCAIGYAEIMDHLAGKTSIDEAIELIKKNSRQLAKAQRTWFKTFRMVKWIDVKEDDTVEKVVPKAMAIID
ncbi:MAG: tRNA (adenosine(37)-N6)-dimethylallyltransferase MiaA [Sedimentisphaerales bacterium]|nr:tRNA (adenosine(37)-N6)-dimethylallyltransferase MiaA [Sedimentisphaerales bacterium]